MLAATILSISLMGAVEAPQKTNFWYQENVIDEISTANILMPDPYGRLRIYTEKDLTVDKTWRNEIILRRLRQKHNSFYFNSLPNPKIKTHDGNGYIYGF